MSSSGQMVQSSSFCLTPHLSRKASHKYSSHKYISYYLVILCRGSLWYFVALVIYFATAKAELRAILAAHFNYIAQKAKFYNYVTRR